MESMRIDRVVCGAYAENAYIVRAGGAEGALVIDPGDDYANLRAEIARLGALPEAVVLTHGHFDHLLSAAHLQRDFGARVCVSQADSRALLDDKVNLLPANAVTPFLPISADKILSPGEWTFRGLSFQILAAPGHTPGGVCLYAARERVIFTGDTLFDDGFGRTDLPGGDWPQLYHTLKALFQLPDDLFVYPGHGEGAQLGEIRKGFYK